MKQRINSKNAPAALGPYSQAIALNGMVYTAGQVGIDHTTGKLVEGGIEEQTHQVLKNLTAVLDAAGTSLDNVVKSTVFLSDMANFAAMNGVYAQYFSAGAPPARSTVQVAGLPLAAMVEIECVAAINPD